jgi:hypothetical protein
VRRQPIQLAHVQALSEQECALCHLARRQDDPQLLHEAGFQAVAAGAIQRRSRPQTGRVREVAVTADEGAAVAGIRGILELRPGHHRAGEDDAAGEVTGGGIDGA